MDSRISKYLRMSLAGDRRMVPSRLLAANGPVLWLLLIGLPIGGPARPKLHPPTVARKVGLPPNGPNVWFWGSYVGQATAALPIR